MLGRLSSKPAEAWGHFPGLRVAAIPDPPAVSSVAELRYLCLEETETQDALGRCIKLS